MQVNPLSRMRAIVDKEGKPTQVMQLFSEELKAFLEAPDFANGISVGNVDNADPNVLDWYKEQTFTPVAIGLTTAGAATYTNQYGSGYRAGNRFHFQITLSWTAHTGTGSLGISGLPFTSSATALFSSVTCYSQGIARGAGEVIQAVIQPSMSRVLLALSTAAGAATGLAVPASAQFLILSGSYEV